MTSVGHEALEHAAREHERFLWGLCYRMTGVAADADELVQETYARALATPPERSEELRPWLTRVAMNLARDRLRRRKREGYVGPWLPSPVETGEEAVASVEAHLPGGGTTEGRYELLESVTFAFLLALEALTPRQRAVLLLRDVFDYPVREVAGCLRMSETNVKVTHHRARAVMAAYDRERCVPTRELQERTRRALEDFLGALVSGDVAAAEALLAEPVRALSDGGGETFAARVPVVGVKRVALFYRRLHELGGVADALEVRMINGLPALVARWKQPAPGRPTRVVVRLDIGEDGRVRVLHSIQASRKLAGLPTSA
ncbi:RNA polymerase sigma-70 factor, ECF subfamily [Cystobacter fuscus DSM 2262]|uniref:RNA polymerase sigma-70 factor, ECF subfamily n=1 Tax=Cystobacter fuscus (strain ATCC 25194 / DSM 2262 / NBRC 100088 / M29) TaxID=1242864 RepID=S9QJ37_CYSF2|nr:sigma-70 family RNA polymerase sigma factor [Cystobacter fuscus]EPX61299.1 RNA polymerase sigma-70 factor, ECF subfamily [Cystobacter fuscus DSM 2262]